MMPWNKLFLVSALLLISLAGFSQNQVIKLQKREATLKTMITAIEKQTKKSVDYGQNVMNLKKVVRVSATQMKLSDLLKELFMGTNIEYTITDRHILISQKNKPQTQNTLQSGATIRVKGQVTDENGESLSQALR